MSPQPSMLTRQVIVDGLRYLLAGRLNLKQGHLPERGQHLPEDFIGICVASNENPETDDYVLHQIHALGVKRVRLDIGQDDMYPHQCRFLQRLLQAEIAVDVHLVQPFIAARTMQLAASQQAWQTFVEAFLAQFGTRIHSLEIGNTINRKRWAGYQWPGFLCAWEIAYRAARQYGIKIVGPNIQDFEPFYNISAFRQLAARNMLPDVHSNNLFVERVIEPEQPDHRIFKFRWTRCLRFNLIKKARLLQKIGQDAGIQAFISPVAFWAIYRIQRILPDGPQKQADYVTRYFTLLAASGALRQANWGAMICQREGVINNGLQDKHYPALERVAYYRAADGEVSQYSPNPSFAAFKQIAYWLNGAHYLTAWATGNGLEIHEIVHHGKRVHIAWTINGRCQRLDQLYRAEDLSTVQCYDRDGVLRALPRLVTEKPVFLIWPEHVDIAFNPSAASLSPVRIHAHVSDREYFPIHHGSWQGMVLAHSADEAQSLFQAWHPEKLEAPDKAMALRHARNVIWSVPDPRDPQSQVTVKKPVRMHLHKQLLDQYKPSKALRSWNGGMELMRRGIETAQPVAYFERKGDRSLLQNFYFCAFVKHDFTIAQPWQAFNQRADSYAGYMKASVFDAFARFCHRMHASGIYFRDFSAGNILVTIKDHQLAFSLIDTARLRTFPLSTPIRFRLADLARALNKLNWPDRKRFLQQYLAMSGMPIKAYLLLPFYLYDAKVACKRTFGRKGLRKVLRWVKSRLD